MEIHDGAPNGDAQSSRPTQQQLIDQLRDPNQAENLPGLFFELARPLIEHAYASGSQGAMRNIGNKDIQVGEFKVGVNDAMGPYAVRDESKVIEVDGHKYQVASLEISRVDEDGQSLESAKLFWDSDSQLKSKKPRYWYNSPAYIAERAKLVPITSNPLKMPEEQRRKYPQFKYPGPFGGSPVAPLASMDRGEMEGVINLIAEASAAIPNPAPSAG